MSSAGVVANFLRQAPLLLGPRSSDNLVEIPEKYAFLLYLKRNGATVAEASTFSGVLANVVFISRANAETVTELPMPSIPSLLKSERQT